jgi:hypothetical protein
VDVEFATAASGAVLLLQVRPVTAVATVKMSARGTPKRTLAWGHSTPRLLRCNQQVLKPLTQLGHYAWNGGRVGTPADVGDGVGVTKALKDMMAVWFGDAWPNDNYCCIINGFMYTTQGQGEKAARMPPPSWILRALSFFGAFSALENQCTKNSKERILMKQLKEWDQVRRPRFDLLHNELGAANVASLELTELKKHYERCLANFADCVWHHYFYVITVIMPSGALVAHVLRHLPDEDKASLFMLPSNPAGDGPVSLHCSHSTA